MKDGLPTKFLSSSQQNLTTLFQLVKVSPLHNRMSTLTTGAEDNCGDASSRKQGGVHPAQTSNEFGLMPQLYGCLMAYCFDDERVFGNLEGIAYHACFQRRLESRISRCNLIEYALYLRLNYLLGFPWNCA